MTHIPMNFDFITFQPDKNTIRYEVHEKNGEYELISFVDRISVNGVTMTFRNSCGHFPNKQAAMLAKYSAIIATG